MWEALEQHLYSVQLINVLLILNKGVLQIVGHKIVFGMYELLKMYAQIFVRETIGYYSFLF